MTAGAARRGLTLIELMVVVGIIALMIGIGALGVSSIRGADVSTTASLLTGAMRYVYTLAVHKNRTYRIVIDMDERRFYTEVAETDDPCARYSSQSDVNDEKKPGDEDRDKDEEGAEAAAETTFVADDGELLSEDFRQETNVTAVMTEHHQEPQTGGKAVIYFYPGGRAERAMIWVGEQDEVDGQLAWTPELTLVLESLGRVTRYGEPLNESEFSQELK